MNYIEQYYKMIDSGEIVAGEKIKKVYAHVVDNLHNANSEYYFDEKEAEKTISFIENFCCIPKFQDGKQPFKLQLWQKALISCLFGFRNKETQHRQYKELFLYVSRKNAKSCLNAAIILYILLFSQEAAQEVYSVATDRQQSKIIWDYAKQMIATSPLLKKHFQIKVNEICQVNGFNKFVPLSKNSGSMDGLSPSVMALDELHAIKDRNLYDVVKGGMYSRSEPLTLIMSTGGYIEQDSIFDSKYQEYISIINGYEDGKYRDETVLPLLYELDSKSEIADETMWMKANPNLGVSKSIDMLKQEVQRAKLNEKTLRDILVKQFNIRENAKDSFFNFEDVTNDTTFNIADLQGTYFLGGIDLSQTTDLTAATALIPCDGKLYVEQMYWMPKDTLQEHIETDGVPYDMWITRGLMRLCEGRIINPSDVCAWFLELQNDYGLYAYQIGYDRYNASYLVKELEENFGKNLCKPINQSFIGLSSYMFESKAYFKNKDVIYNNNPIFKWCLLNTLCVTDTSGNIKPYKNRNLTKRIDGYSSFLDAFVLYLENKNDL